MNKFFQSNDGLKSGRIPEGEQPLKREFEKITPCE